MFAMFHYCVKQPDGTIHVTNMVGPYEGQHHIHTGRRSFNYWARNVEAAKIKWMKTTKPCTCGQTPPKHERTR